MPHDRLKSLRVRSYAGGFNRRHYYDAIADLLGVTAVAPYNPKDFHSAQLRLLQAGDDVWTNILFKIPASHRQYQHGITGFRLARAQPSGKYRIPPLIV